MLVLEDIYLQPNEVITNAVPKRKSEIAKLISVCPNGVRFLPFRFSTAINQIFNIQPITPRIAYKYGINVVLKYEAKMACISEVKKLLQLLAVYYLFSGRVI